MVYAEVFELDSLISERYRSLTVSKGDTNFWDCAPILGADLGAPPRTFIRLPNWFAQVF